jgi:hypothetical protein
MNMCEVCLKNKETVSRIIPLTDIKAEYCEECWKAGAHPWLMLVRVTAEHNGLRFCKSDWIRMVHSTNKHLGRSLEEFERRVRNEMESSYVQGMRRP